MRNKVLALVTALVAGAAIAAPAAEAKAFRGTVVKRNVATRTVVVATRSGRLVIVHGTRARVGTILRVGTHIRVIGHTRHVRLKGLVTQRGLRSFSLSASNAVVNVRLRSHHSRHVVGAGLNVHARITAGGTVTETSSDDTEDVEGAELKGTLLCIPTSADCGTGGPTPTPMTLFIDTGDPSGPIPVTYDPNDPSHPEFSDATLGPLVGQQVEANVSISAPGGVVTLTLNAIAAENSCTSGSDDSEDTAGTSGGSGGTGGNDLLDGSGTGTGSGDQGDDGGDQGGNSQGDDACEADD
jgi:hypothetical protein